MKKFLLFLMLALSLGIPHVQAQTAWSSTTTTAATWRTILGIAGTATTNPPTKWMDSTANKNAGLADDFQWTWDIAWDGTTKYCQVGSTGVTIGSSNGKFTKATLSTSGLVGKIISNVTITGCKTNGTTGSIQVNVNGTTKGTATLSTTAKDISIDLGNTEVTTDVEIVFQSITSGKQLVLTGLKFTFNEGTLTPTAPSTPTFSIEGVNVAGSYEADYNTTVAVVVKSEGAESLTFTSPEGIGTVTGNTYTLAGITTPTAISVKGTNSTGDSDAATLNVTFAPAPEIKVDAPTFTLDDAPVSGSVKVKEGSVIKAATVTTGATVTLTAEPAEAATIEGATATVYAPCTLTAIATLADKTASSTLDVTIKEVTPLPANAFHLLTDLSQLKDGMEVIIANGTNAISTTVTNNKFSPATVTLNEDKDAITEYGEKTAIFTLEKGTGDNVWYFKNADGGYITWTGTTNVNYSKTTQDATAKATLSKTSDAATTVKIQFNADTSRSLIWRSGSSNIFGQYAVSNVNNTEYYYVNIYYREGAVTAPSFLVPENTTFEKDAEGNIYYTNSFDLLIKSDTEGAVIHYYIDDIEEQTGDNPVSFKVDHNQTIKAFAAKDGVPSSETVTATYRFRTAAPVISCNDREDAEVKNVTISTATNGAYIQYSLDNGATWSDPVQNSVTLTFNEMGTSVNIMARAYSDFEEEGSFSATIENQVAIYPALKWLPFELLTDVTMLVPGEEVIFVSDRYDVALAPYIDGDKNCKVADITKTETDGTLTVRLDPASEAVGIYKVEKTDGGKFRFKGTFHGGYLAAVAGNDNLLHCHADADLDDKHASEATVIVDPVTGIATVTFEAEGVTHNTLRYFTGNSKVFTCYEPSSTGSYDINIYRRSEVATYTPRPVATPREGVYDEGDINEVTLQCLDADGNVVDDPTLKIYYTLDGTDPRMGGSLYTTPILVSDNMTVRAYASMDGCFDSPSLIASYDIFRPGKEYRRVTAAEMRHLQVNDDIIILASPSDEDAVYAMSRRQNGEESSAYREAVRLDDAVKSDGRIIINDKEVQVLTLLPAVDYYTGGDYDWRLYASGSSIGADYNMDGYLMARDNNNALETQRIDTPASELLPTVDVRFRSLAADNQGNEYGGIVPQFGALNGHELDYPKLMALSRNGDSYRFDVRSEADFDAASWYVSVFKIFDANFLYAPSFTITDHRISQDTPVEITSPNSESHPDTQIWYSLDEGDTWSLYTGPFFFDNLGEYTVMARTRNLNLEGCDEEGYSVVTSQSYLVSMNELFELVTDASQLKENDRIIFVNALNYPYKEEGSTGWYSATTFDSTNGRFESEQLLLPDGTLDASAIPQQIIVPSEAQIQVFRLEYDTSASNPGRPWLLNAGEDAKTGEILYLSSAEAKKFKLATLPEDVEDRQYMNVGFDIDNSTDFGTYNYNNGNVSTKEADKTIIEHNATVTFNGTKAQNFLRFNPAGGLRFRGYDNGGKGTPSGSTWPIRVYRADKRVLPPTVTVFDATTDNSNAYETEIETFNNAVRVVVRQNPRTDRGTNLRYSWSRTLENAPVLSEYLKADPEDAEEVELLVDGNKIQTLYNGNYVSIPGLPTIDGKHVFRAVAADNVYVSESLPRIINFQCAKPILTKDGDSNAVKVSRPVGYTVNAQIYYAYDDDEIIVDDAHVISYIDGTNDFEPIPFDGHDKVRVVAVKDGYAQSEVAVYTPYTFTPRAHAVQLLLLTDEGKTNFAGLLSDDDKDFINSNDDVYVTYRTVPTGQFYLIKEDGEGLAMAACTDNVAARQFIDYRPANASQSKVNVKWTTDYYVHVLDEDDFLNAVGEDSEIDNVNVYVNGSSTAHPAQMAMFMLNDGIKTYYGLLLKRHGAIGTIKLKSELDYYVLTEDDVEEYIETGYDQITPLIPSVYGGHYAYVYSQQEQDLSTVYPSDFLKFKVESQIKKNADGSRATTEVLMPTADLNPRHFDAVITFFRPNVSDEILRRNDIYYTINFQGVDRNVKGSGLYVDRAQADLELAPDDIIPEFYQFTVTDVSPRGDIFPRLEVNATEYVENFDGSDNYGRFLSNYGDNIAVEARNIPTLGVGTVEKIHVGKLSPNEYDMFGNMNRGSEHAWMYKGHYHLDYPGDVAHDNMDNTEDAVLLAPSYYLVETYNSNGTEYCAYEYLVKHVAGHASQETPLDFEDDGTFITDDEDDPLMGTYIASSIPVDGVTVSFTPVYIFSRNPEAAPDGEHEDIIAQLDKVQSFDIDASVMRTNAASRGVVSKVASETTYLGRTVSAPTLGEQRPMRYYGHTDMTADNITDLTDDDAPFDVVAGNTMSRTINSEEVTGVENVNVNSDDTDVEYYNLQGLRILNPGHGIYIRRHGNISEKVVL